MRDELRARCEDWLMCRHIIDHDTRKVESEDLDALERFVCDSWTTEKPKVPGWYWWRVNEDDAEVVQIYEVAGVLAVDSIEFIGKPLKQLGGEWSTHPLPEPMEGV